MTSGRRDPTDDAGVVLEMAAGSEAALEALYDRHATAIFAAVYRLTSDRGTAEEVVQETFLTLWNRAETFDPMTGSLASWLHAIARNRAIDRLRAIGRRPSMVGLGALGAPDEDPTQALERLAVRGSVVAGSAPSADPEADRGRRDASRDAPRRRGAMPDDERTRHPARIPGRPVADRDRGTARLAARDRQDADAAGPASSARRCWEGNSARMPDDAVMPVPAGEDR